MRPTRISEAPAKQTGIVALVGAGPGDPELLTIRALRWLREADAIVHDHLVGDEILELARRRAKRIYVGKESGHHTLPQPAINELLLSLARQGKRVVRLKGGDPFVFGRGGEEAEYLAAHGIPIDIVPGITSAGGGSCYAGIPLTHRDHAQSCIFVTGHTRDGGPDIDWRTLARRRQTVVIYMGLARASEISAQLIAHGMAPDMPAAIIERATTTDQRVAVGTIASLPILAESMRPPALIIIGTVVRLRAALRVRGAVSAGESADCVEISG